MVATKCGMTMGRVVMSMGFATKMANKQREWVNVRWDGEDWARYGAAQVHHSALLVLREGEWTPMWEAVRCLALSADVREQEEGQEVVLQVKSRL